MRVTNYSSRKRLESISIDYNMYSCRPINSIKANETHFNIGGAMIYSMSISERCRKKSSKPIRSITKLKNRIRYAYSIKQKQEVDSVDDN